MAYTLNCSACGCARTLSKFELLLPELIAGLAQLKAAA